MTDTELRAWVVEALDDRIVMAELDDGQLRWEFSDRAVPGGLMLTGQVMSAADWKKAKVMLNRLQAVRSTFVSHTGED